MNKEREEENMSFKERLKTTIMRTIGGITIILIGIKFFLCAINWQKWTSPNSELGLVLVVLIYVCTVVIILYGGYLVSPIWTEIIVHNWLKWILSQTMLNEPDRKEIVQEEKEFRRKIRDLRREYLW